MFFDTLIKDQRIDSLLLRIFQLFHYVARCGDLDLDSKKEYLRNQKIFKQYSTTKVLEEAVSLRNVDKRLNSGKEIWERNIIWNVRSPGKLMGRMEEIFGLNIYKLMVLASTEYNQEDIEDIGDEQLKKQLNICIRDGNCDELKGMVMEQGIILQNYNYLVKLEPL